MESKKYAIEINSENMGLLVQYHANGAWRIGTLASVNADNVQITPITGGQEKTIARDDVRLVVREPEKPKPAAKVTAPKKPVQIKTNKPASRFNLAAAFAKARARMLDPDRKRCKHGHTISAKNACVADLKRMGK